MTNAGFRKIQEFRDMPTLNEYQHQKDIHADTLKYLNRARVESRDNGRTPFQWDSTANAGFTTGIPWIGVNPNYKIINAAAEERDPKSCLNYFRKLVRLRKNNPTLVYCRYRLLDKDNPNVYAYTRLGEGKKMLILLNFAASSKQTSLNIPVANAKLLLSNYNEIPVRKKGNSIFILRPYEAAIFQLQ
jgi:oligo-1,6-glucosidase